MQSDTGRHSPSAICPNSPDKIQITVTAKSTLFCQVIIKQTTQQTVEENLILMQ